MRLRRAVVVGFSLMIGIQLLFGAKGFWNEVPYTEWNESQARKILSDSPWTARKSLNVFSGRRVAGDRSTGKFSFLANLRSALPSRMALARIAVLNGQFDQENAEKYLAVRLHDGETVIAVSSDSPDQMSILDTLTTAELRATTSLTIGKKGEQLPLKRYIPPSQSTTSEAMFLFERREVPATARQIEFETRLDQVKLKVRFKPADLIFDGAVEI